MQTMHQQQRACSRQQQQHCHVARQPCRGPSRRRRTHLAATQPSSERAVSSTENAWHTLQGKVLAALLSACVTLPGAQLPASAAEDFSMPELLPAMEEAARKLPPLPTSFPALPQLSLPDYQEVTLDNGLKVLLLEDHEVPLVRGAMILPGGQYAGAAQKPGVAAMTARVQRSGGSEQHPGPELDSRLEELAAAIEVGGGDLALSAEFQSMSEDVDEVVGLLAEVVRTPAFPDREVAVNKAQMINGLQHRNDRGGAIARRELQRLVYGQESVYAKLSSTSDIKSLSREDLVQFQQLWQRPDTALLGIVGDFDSEQMLLTVKNAFGDWAPAPGQPAQPPQQPFSSIPPQVNAGKVFLVDKPGSSQASVVVGEVGVQMADPDQYPLDTLASILNSFGGRLFDQVRSREGLAYSVAGGWEVPPDHPGLFVAGGETSRPAEFLAAMLRVLGDATVEPPLAEELSQAKAETLNSFVFNFSSQYAQLQRLLVQDLLGIPQEYLFQYRDNIQAVSADSVLEAAQRHLHPTQMTAVVVGDATAVQPQLVAAGFDVVPLQLDPV